MTARPHGTSVEGIAMVGVTAFAWGLNWPVLKFMMAEWPPFVFRVLSGGGAALLLLGVLLVRRERLLPRRGDWPRLIMLSILNITSWMGLATLSLIWLAAAEAAILAYTMPIWASVLAWPILGERPTPRRIVSLVLGLGGVFVLLAGQVLATSAAALVAKLPGVVLILGTAWLFAAGAVQTKRRPLDMPPVTAVFWQVLIGTVPLVAAAGLFDRWDLSRVTPLGWAGLAYLAVIAMCVAYLAWFRALRLLPAASATVGMLMVPVIGVLSSAALLGEPIGLRHILALAMTLGGVVLATLG